MPAEINPISIQHPATIRLPYYVQLDRFALRLTYSISNGRAIKTHLNITQNINELY